MTSQLDRRRPPTLPEPATLRWPELERRTVSPADAARSIEVLHLPRLGGLVHCSLLVGAGAALESTSRAGELALAVDLLDEGTSAHPGDRLSAAVERLGGELSSGTGWESCSVRISGLESSAHRLLELLGEAATDSEFDAAAVRRLGRARCATLERLRADPGRVADQAVSSALFPDHRRAVPLTGIQQALQDATGTSLAGRWRALSGSRRLGLVVVGDLPSAVDLDAWIELLASNQTDREAETPSEHTRPLPEPRRRVVLLVDRPHAAQTELRVAHRSPHRRAPGRAGRRLLNSILGGKFTSRLNLRLREQDGSTYGVSSGFQEGVETGAFVVRSATDTASVTSSVAGILEEMERLRDEEVTPEEISDAHAYLSGVVPYGLQTVGGLSAQLQTQWLHELPDDALEVEMSELATLGRSDVLQTARDCLRPDECVVVAVGPALSLAESFGPLRDRGFEIVETDPNEIFASPLGETA